MIGAARQATYSELPLGKLDRTKIEAVWRYQAESDASCEQLVLPDGRMDLVAHCAVRPNGKVGSVWLVIAGPADLPTHAAFRSNTVIFGVRFHLGWGGACLALEPAALLNRTISGGALGGLLGPLSHQLLRAETLHHAESELRCVVGALAEGAPSSPAHRLALDAIEQMKLHVHQGRRPHDRHTKGSSRTLRRHVVATAGLSIRSLTGILRFQRALATLQHNDLALSEIALSAGYTDQSHMTRDFRRFGGFTPSRPQSAPLVQLVDPPPHA